MEKTPHPEPSKDRVSVEEALLKAKEQVMSPSLLELEMVETTEIARLREAVAVAREFMEIISQEVTQLGYENQVDSALAKEWLAKFGKS